MFHLLFGIYILQVILVLVFLSLDDKRPSMKEITSKKQLYTWLIPYRWLYWLIKNGIENFKNLK